jgi:acyl CoA:acetate/3-ketoacid CoA transferase beta subunit
VVVATTHTTKHGNSKIKDICSLPLTGRWVVDMIITDLAVFRVYRGKGMELIEHAPDVSVDYIRKHTSATFTVSPLLQEMLQ